MQPRRGLDALLDVIENLQGAPLAASVLETEVLPARLVGYKSSDLDTLIAAGEVVWVGMEPIGERDGRVGLYLAEKLPVLWQRQAADGLVSDASKELAIVEYLKARGASFFQDLHDGVGGGYPGRRWRRFGGWVWKGMVTNDGMAALRARAVSALLRLRGGRGCTCGRGRGSDRDGRLRLRGRGGGG